MRAQPSPSRDSPTGLVVAVCLALFVDALLYSVVVPALPTFAEAFDLEPVGLGALYGAYALALLLATPVAGRVGDRVGHRGPFVLGSAGVAVATLGFALADSYPQLLAARILQGASAGGVWTSGIALLALRVPRERQGQLMGTAMAAMSVGMIAGPPLGGFLIDHGGRRTPFLACALLTAATAVLVPVLAGPQPVQTPASVSARALLGDVRVRRVLLAVGTGAAALAALEALLPLDLVEDLGWDPLQIGLVFGGATLVHGLASPVAGRLADRRGEAALMTGGVLVMAVLLPLIAAAHHLVAVAVCLAVFAAAFSAVLVPALPRLSRLGDGGGSGGGQGSVFAAFNIAYAVGMVVGPGLGGLAAQAVDIRVVLALLCPPLLLVAGLLRRRPAGEPTSAAPANTPTVSPAPTSLS